MSQLSAKSCLPVSPSPPPCFHPPTCKCSCLPLPPLHAPIPSGKLRPPTRNTCQVLMHCKQFKMWCSELLTWHTCDRTGEPSSPTLDEPEALTSEGEVHLLPSSKPPCRTTQGVSTGWPGGRLA